jgi:hypothetical protein
LQTDGEDKRTRALRAEHAGTACDDLAELLTDMGSMCRRSRRDGHGVVGSGSGGSGDDDDDYDIIACLGESCSLELAACEANTECAGELAASMASEIGPASARGKTKKYGNLLGCVQDSCGLPTISSREQLSDPPKRCSSVATAVLAALTFILTVGVIVLAVWIRKLVGQVTAAHQHVLQQDRHATVPMTSNPMIQQPSPPPEYLLPEIGQEAIYTQTKIDQAVSDFNNEDPSTSYAELDAGHAAYGSSA